MPTVNTKGSRWVQQPRSVYGLMIFVFGVWDVNEINVFVYYVDYDRITCRNDTQYSIDWSCMKTQVLAKLQYIPHVNTQNTMINNKGLY